MTLQMLVALFRLTLSDPQAAARQVLAMRLPMQALWIGLALMAVVSALLLHFSFSLQPGEDQAMFGPLMASPLRSAVLQGVVLALSAWVMAVAGRRFGGNGSFADALALMIWLQAVLVVVQVAQLLAFALVPVLAGLIGLASLGLFLWLLTQFTKVLHGFTSAWAVLAGIVFVSLLMIFALSVVLALILGPMGGV